MRIYEILAVVLDIPILVFGVAHRSWPVWMNGSVVLALVAFLVHVVFEGARWQMIPAYLVCGGLGIYCLTDLSQRNHLNLAASLGAMTLLSSSVVLATVLPVFSLPAPNGPNAIGTVTRRWTREAVEASGQHSQRTLTVQFWYPTEVRTGERSLYRTDDAEGLKSHLRLVETHSFLGVPVSAKKFPIILYSPGWQGHLTQNTVQFEMLASNGYVVISVMHPPDSHVPISFDPSLDANLQEYSVEVRRRADDVIFLVNELEKVNRNDPAGLFVGHLDTSRIGIMGFSFGGAVATETCWLDQRFRAGINMDGMLFGEAADAGVQQPFFFMSDDTPAPSEAAMQSKDSRMQTYLRALDTDGKRIEKSLAQHGGYYFTMRGQAHSNFSDEPLFSPLRRITGAGSSDAKRSSRILNEYILAFFEQHLNGSPQPLLSRQPSDYPEVVFRHEPAPSSVSEGNGFGNLSRLSRLRP
jgi:predicted dienelactone hydrolase